jgi:hypothetical protein
MLRNPGAHRQCRVSEVSSFYAKNTGHFLTNHFFALNAFIRLSSLAGQRGVERKPEVLPFLLLCRRIAPLPLKIPDSDTAARTHSIEVEKPGILCRAFQDRSC